MCKKQYDLFGREILKSNSLNEIIHTAYHRKGEALRKEVTDPRGVKTVTTFNSLRYDGHSRKFNACNALLKQRKHRYSYDLNGNRISDGLNKYKYDALDRLIEVTTSSSKYRYVYDALNRRVARLNDNQVEYYLWQKQQEVGSVSEDGVIQELKILDPLNRAVALELHGTLYVPVHDVMGNVRGLLDESGNNKATYRYSAFGEEQISGEILSPWRYSGKRVDLETGLLYFGERYYDIKTLCWLNPDPIGDAGGLNHYAYVLNNPLYYTDLMGEILQLLLLGHGLLNF